jgi:hypothetical protein
MRRWPIVSTCAAALALLLTRSAGATEPDARFVDRRGKLRDFEHEYRVWFLDREQHPLRAAIESLVWIGLGTAYYWLDPLANSEDWDDPSIWEKVRGEALSYDNNLGSTNFILHPFAGAAIYGTARLNGLPVWTSFAYAATSSLAWEYALEWREQASVNDLVFTAIGGVALGEFLFRISEYASSAPENRQWGNVVAAHTLGLPHRLHELVDGPRPRTSLPPDSLGFSSAYAHRFGLSYAFGQLQNDLDAKEPVHTIGLSAELAAIPGFLRQGQFDLGFYESNFVEGALRFSYEGTDLAEVDAQVSTVSFGYLTQAFDRRGGTAQLIGLGTGLRYYDSWKLERRDRYSFVHLPRPVFGFWARSGKLRARARLSAGFDFAGIRPLALDAWRERYGDYGLRSVLLRRSYTYAGCASSRAELNVTVPALGAGALANAGWCRSLGGMDRFDDHPEPEVSSVDSLLELGAWASVRPDGPIELRLELDHNLRRGSMGPLDAARWDARGAAAIAYVF